MTRLRALKIHAFHDAAASLTAYLTAAVLFLALALGQSFADAVLFGAAALAFTAIMASVATDMMSKRIPNSLSLMLLLAAPAWWLGVALGGDVGTQTPGIALDLMSLLDPQYGSGPLLPGLGLSFPLSIGLDILGTVIVFLPLYASFRLGLGFGGGDVKLITAGALFFGWPLGLDFLVVSYVVGGLISVFVIAGRKFCRIAMRGGATSERVRRYAQLREFPYAPAIAVSAILCLASKLEGLF